MPTIIVSEDGTQKSKCSVQFRRCQIGTQFWWEKQMTSDEFINNFDQKKTAITPLSLYYALNRLFEKILNKNQLIQHPFPVNHQEGKQKSKQKMLKAS